MVFKTYAEMIAAPEGALKGKIVAITQPMVRAQDGAGYGVAGISRRAGPVEAAKRGAAGLLIRSISTSDSTVPHTGVTAFGDQVAAIPAAAIGVPEAEQLERLATLKVPMRVKLNLQSSVDPNDVAWNISGEIKGSEKPDEVIVIGGHLDSWDVGTGALDDATGVAITTAAAKLIGDLPKHPKRTIRVVMWGSERAAARRRPIWPPTRTSCPRSSWPARATPAPTGSTACRSPRVRQATRPCRPPPAC